MDFRVQNTQAALDSQSFGEFASGYGGLRITSAPDGASIEVDKKKWDSNTNTQDGAAVGERQIKLSKSGYEDEYGTAVVIKGKWTLFHRDLKKK